MGKYKSFKGGYHTHDYKEYTKDKPTITAKAPAELRIALRQHIGAPAQAIVKRGDLVKKGQMIGEPRGFVSVPIHSSVSGKVKKIEPVPHPQGGYVMSVIIENDYEEAWTEEIDFYLKKPRSYENFTKKEIIEIVKNAGIVGMGGAAFPTHVKLSPPPEKIIDTLLVNAAECEPWLTSDHRVMLENSEAIISGVLTTMKALGIEKTAIGVETNKLNAIEVLKEAAKNHKSQIDIVPLVVKYPQGSEKQLIKAVLNREVPALKLPMDAGVVVCNVSTIKAIDDAVKYSIPSIERNITITGDCITEPKNFLVKIGTLVDSLLEECGGFSETPQKILSGGPMMGIAQQRTDIPVVKGMSGILALSAKLTKCDTESNCIRCGRCVQVCPMGLEPVSIDAKARKWKFDECETLGVMNCMECGSCSYICPSKRHITQALRSAKRAIISKRKNQN